MQTLKLEYVELCNRNANATKYLRSKSRKRKRTKNAISTIFGILAIAGLLLGSAHKLATEEFRYAIPTETSYQYVTEKLCEVTEISGNFVTVEHNGNAYSFYGTDFEVGQNVVCQFTDNMEIVGTR